MPMNALLGGLSLAENVPKPSLDLQGSALPQSLLFEEKQFHPSLYCSGCGAQACKHKLLMSCPPVTLHYGGA
jgi:hypothetical protein